MRTLITTTLVGTALVLLVACGDGDDTDTATDTGADDVAADADADDVGADADADGDDVPVDVPEADGDAGDVPDVPVVGECRDDSPEGLMGCVERDRYLPDLELVTGDRDDGSAHWLEVQDLCAERFAAMGYAVERHDYGGGVNVIGVLEGGDLAAERVLVSAHYDHIEGCSGADDNASGVAGTLEAGRVLAMASFRRTIVLACWDQEEDGLVGSDAYAVRAIASGENIVASLVFEMIGYSSDEPGSQRMPAGLEYLYPAELAWLEANEYRGNFIVILADEASRSVHELLSLYAPAVSLPIIVLEIPEYLKKSPIIADLRRSDHASFWDQDIPSTNHTDSAEFRNPHYHCAEGDDTVDTLDIDFAVRNVQIVVGAAAATLEFR